MGRKRASAGGLGQAGPEVKRAASEEKKTKKEKKKRWAGPQVEVRWVGFVFFFFF
jgi:hypothetical protein